MEKYSEKKECILRAAERLFEVQGFNGTGVDRIASESGVTKRTLYKHFGSKEGLIREVLKHHHTSMMERVREGMATVEGGAEAKLMAYFRLYREWFGSSRFSGCLFIKTLNEFAGCSTELGRIAVDAKASVRALVYEIAVEGGAKDPETLADQLQLLLEGSIVLAQSGRGPELMDVAEELYRQLVASAFA